VPIDLIIRGICSLRPGLPEISETIRVFSVVDRFLEHSRILVFGEGSRQQVFLSSADWMPRNFERRVEVMFPVEADDLRRRIVEEIIPAYLSDNRRMRMLRSDGTYIHVPAEDAAPHRSQFELLELAATRDANGAAVSGRAPLTYDGIPRSELANGEPFRTSEKRKKKRSSAK
jgi:polyphosphate kinase